jgi:hypothetical protein
MQTTTESSELNALRREWIALLRSGKYTQGEGRLALVPINWNDDKTYNLEMGKSEHCCIGVWCANRLKTEFYGSVVPESYYDNDTYDTEIEIDNTQFYDQWSDELKIPLPLKEYLMSMNDGNNLYTNFDRTRFTKSDKFDDCTIPYRNNSQERSFEFIARFLEIVWGLSPQ